MSQRSSSVPRAVSPVRAASPVRRSPMRRSPPRRSSPVRRSPMRRSPVRRSRSASGYRSRSKDMIPRALFRESKVSTRARSRSRSRSRSRPRAVSPVSPVRRYGYSYEPRLSRQNAIGYNVSTQPAMFPPMLASTAPVSANAIDSTAQLFGKMTLGGIPRRKIKSRSRKSRKSVKSQYAKSRKTKSSNKRRTSRRK